MPHVDYTALLGLPRSPAGPVEAAVEPTAAAPKLEKKPPVPGQPRRRELKPPVPYAGKSKTPAPSLLGQLSIYKYDRDPAEVSADLFELDPSVRVY